MYSNLYSYKVYHLQNYQTFYLPVELSVLVGGIVGKLFGPELLSAELRKLFFQ